MAIGPTSPGTHAGEETAEGRTVPARRSTGACLHCGLPLSEFDRRRETPFCCAGCERVYELIQAGGFIRYYDLRRGPTAPPSDRQQDSLAWLDRILTEADGAGERDQSRRIVLDIQGIHCTACVWLLQTLFGRMRGMHQLTINPSLGKAEIVWTPAQGDLRSFVTEAGRFGYRFGPDRKSIAPPSRRLALRLGVSIAAALNVMIFSVCFYVGLAPSDGSLYRYFGQLNLILATLTVAIGGSVFIRAAATGLRRRLVHLDLPIALGIVLSYGGSFYAYLSRGPEAAYFDTVTIFIALMLVGRWLQERILAQNRNALLAAEGIEGLVTRRHRGGRLESIPAVAIEQGDELWIVPGDLVPVEGILIERPAIVSLDWITGESEPVTVEPGETIPAGAFNAGRATFRLAAQEEMVTSRLNDLMRPSDGHSEAKREDRWWHQVATLYTAAVLLFAAVGFFLWTPRDLHKAIEVTIAILVVTCPCALGLASPLAQELTHLNLRRLGVFLQSASFLDRALAVRKVLFDKTGTVTSGRLVLDPESVGALESLEPEERAVLLEMVVRSNHPVSRAIAERLHEKGEVNGDHLVTEISGDGLSYERNGHLWRVGRAGFAVPGSSDDVGGTTFSRDGRPLATLRMSEEIKRDATEEIARLREEGLVVHILSGDRADKVASAAARLGVEQEQAEGELTPEAKAARVASIDARDTLMVGDGLNDAPSFAAAFCTATPVIDSSTLASRADFYFLGAGISAVRSSLQAARRLRRVVRGNLIFAVLYNLAALTLCLMGHVTPVVAAILMPLSSVGVVSLTTARLRRGSGAWKS